MDERKARYILTNLDELADNLKLTEEFWQRFEREKIFPKTYVEHMKFNCCRKTTTTSNDDDDDDEDLKERNFERQESIDGGGCTIKDMIVVYSTLKYYLSVRDEEQGTFFVDCLVKSLQEYKESNLDKIIEKATDLLNEKVTDISNQIERRQAIEISKRGVDKAVYFRNSSREKI
uniref:Uncharacterized protein LOC113795932 n=1 Tax=Dermatophagoides pteronyssinus TaxID=6956 RepID=A0A6P6Y9C3_DERPT|nr:uncharacterized protein LOC113795932 [Dermatophagoides pteronyssinus]